MVGNNPQKIRRRFSSAGNPRGTAADRVSLQINLDLLPRSSKQPRNAQTKIEIINKKQKNRKKEKQKEETKDGKR
jgi:hypothetical protein